MMIDTVLDRFCRLLSAAMVLFLAAMVVMVFGNVVLRYGFNSGIAISEELSRWLFVWMTFLGALVALRSHAHLGTDSLISRLPPRGRRICLGLTQLIMLYLCALMFQGSWQQFRINVDSTSAVMQASQGWFHASGLFFSVFAFLFLLADFWKLLSGRLTQADLVRVAAIDDMPHGNPRAAPGRGT